MSDFAIPPLVKDGFTMAPTLVAGRIVVKVSGNGDMETPLALSGYLKSLHAEALRIRAIGMTFECQELYFMSSACVKCLVAWVDGILRLEEERRYSVRIRANQNLHWQRRSFEALRRFAPTIVSIDG
jgi:hypothetical protein